MARSRRVVVALSGEQLILSTLIRISPGVAASYEQCILDLGDLQRRSYRGVAHELREVLREVLDYLAPDKDVLAEAGFRLEEGRTKPTQRQKAQYIFRKRRLSREAMSVPEMTLSMVEELQSQIARDAYSRGAKEAHTVTSGAQVRQLKMWIDALLGEFLQIHKAN